MDMARDPAHGDPWRESLERSLARRRRPRRRTARAPASPELPSYASLCWQALRAHLLTLVAAAAGILSLVLLAAAQPSVSAGQNVRVVILRPRAAQPRADSPVVSADGVCHPGIRSTGYVNPLASARVRPKRIDQGVDYVGSGTLGAIGSGVITQVVLSGTGWPGAFIEYQLRSGPEAGCYVYYAEG